MAWNFVVTYIMCNDLKFILMCDWNHYIVIGLTTLASVKSQRGHESSPFAPGFGGTLCLWKPLHTLLHVFPRTGHIGTPLLTCHPSALCIWTLSGMLDLTEISVAHLQEINSSKQCPARSVLACFRWCMEVTCISENSVCNMFITAGWWCTAWFKIPIGEAKETNHYLFGFW